MSFLLFMLVVMLMTFYVIVDLELDEFVFARNKRIMLKQFLFYI